MAKISQSKRIIMAGVISPDRKRGADFRRLALEYGINFWETATEDQKRELFFRLAPNLIPRQTELSGFDGEPITVQIINYGSSATPVQVQSTAVPAEDTASVG